MRFCTTAESIFFPSALDFNLLSITLFSVPTPQEGTIEVFDLGLSERVSAEQAHEGAVWSLAPLPDGSGFVSGSADKTVKFWQVRRLLPSG
jgi:WD40 repeat protein